MALYFRFEGIVQDPKNTLLAYSYLSAQVKQWIRPRLNEALHLRLDAGGGFQQLGELCQGHPKHLWIEHRGTSRHPTHPTLETKDVDLTVHCQVSEVFRQPWLE